MNNAKRIIVIKQRLTETLKPQHIEVTDESHRHIGHPGAKDGRGHFAVDITADIFSGKTSLQKHRLIYEALNDLMETEIHALRIRATSSDS